jgi:uncharacterized protein YbbC (DUF1343 family)
MITLGIDRLEEYLDLFTNKKVGLITNPTGVNSDFVTTIDLLHKHTNLVALFSPEHGVRGDLQAGVRLDDYVDKDTGCTVYSLYGKNKQPTKEMMDQIDILVFDIQDVGARFYTFIYTMGYALKACGLYDTPMVVFDRPNPVNALTVEGNIIKDDRTSFVGGYSLPQRYGLTIGELARYINEEEKIHADLTVIPMDGYKRSMDYEDTHLHWVLPSPNIPTTKTPYYYLSTCLFEGTNISEGRGTTKPFQIIGSPFFQTKAVLEQLKAYSLPGIAFRPMTFTPTFSKHQGELCHGLELYITDKKSFQPVITGMILLKCIEEIHEDFAFNPPYIARLNPMIDLLTGDDFIRTNRLSIDEITTLIQKDSNDFLVKKRRYHLYEDE